MSLSLTHHAQLCMLFSQSPCSISFLISRFRAGPLKSSLDQCARCCFRVQCAERFKQRWSKTAGACVVLMPFLPKLMHSCLQLHSVGLLHCAVCLCPIYRTWTRLPLMVAASTSLSIQFTYPFVMYKWIAKRWLCTYRPPTKLLEGNVFTGVRHTIHRGNRLSLVPGPFWGVSRGWYILNPSARSRGYFSGRYASYWNAFFF